MDNTKLCPKCDGTGKIPFWPNPSCVLTPNVIARIKENAPDCDRCGGTGKIKQGGNHD